MKRRTAVQLAILAAVTISIGLKVIWTLPYQTEQIWQGYQVALIAETPENPVPRKASGNLQSPETRRASERRETFAANLKKVKQTLHSAGFSKILSYEDQEVSFFRYSGISTFPLSSLPEQLEPQDPRYDPYLKSLPRYFQGSIDGESTHVLYLQRDRAQLPPLFLAEKMRKELDTPVYISGLEPFRQIVLWGFIGITVLTIAALFYKKYRIKGSLIVYLLGALGTLPGMVHLSLSTFTWWLLQFAAWAVLLAWAGPALKRRLNAKEESFFYELKKYSEMYLSVSLAGIAVAVLGGGEDLFMNYAGHSLFTMTIQGGILYGFFLIHKNLSQRQLHSLFVPIHISAGQSLSGSGSALGRREFKRTAAVFLLLLGVLPVVILPGISVLLNREVEYPMPASPSAGRLKENTNTNFTENTRENNFSWQNLIEFDRSTSASDSVSDNLPDFADYLRHRAFQEGYFFGRSYSSFPMPGEKISIPTYRQDGINVLSDDKVVKMFTDQWYEDIISSAHNGGVTQLLLEQNRPVQVKIAELEPFRINTYAILGHIGIMLMMVPVVSFIVSRKIHSQRFLTEKQQQKKGQKVA